MDYIATCEYYYDSTLYTSDVITERELIYARIGGKIKFYINPNKPTETYIGNKKDYKKYAILSILISVLLIYGVISTKHLFAARNTMPAVQKKVYRQDTKNDNNQQYTTAPMVSITPFPSLIPTASLKPSVTNIPAASLKPTASNMPTASNIPAASNMPTSVPWTKKNIKKALGNICNSQSFL